MVKVKRHKFTLIAGWNRQNVIFAQILVNLFWWNCCGRILAPEKVNFSQLLVCSTIYVIARVSYCTIYLFNLLPVTGNVYDVFTILPQPTSRPDVNVNLISSFHATSFCYCFKPASSSLNLENWTDGEKFALRIFVFFCVFCVGREADAGSRHLVRFPWFSWYVRITLTVILHKKLKGLMMRLAEMICLSYIPGNFTWL